MRHLKGSAQEINKQVKLSRSILNVAIIIGLATAIVVPVAAADDKSDLANTYGGGSVTAYAAEQKLSFGTIVQLVPNQTNRVKVAEKSAMEKMFGVAVDPNQLPLTITAEELENETFVAVSGTYNVLVSTEGGSIASGDYVTLSSINGIAMKADLEVKTVFGRANVSFDGNGVNLGKMPIKDTSGNTTQTATLGSIPVTIDIRNNPNEISTQANLPDFLQRIGKEIAQKEVNPVRVYLSLGITLVSIIAAIIMLYAGIRNAVISIGRNPMSKKSIFRAMLEVILAAVLVLIIGLFAVYLLLRL